LFGGNQKRAEADVPFGVRRAQDYDIPVALAGSGDKLGGQSVCLYPRKLEPEWLTQDHSLFRLASRGAMDI